MSTLIEIPEMGPPQKLPSWIEKVAKMTDFISGMTIGICQIQRKLSDGKARQGQTHEIVWNHIPKTSCIVENVNADTKHKPETQITARLRHKRKRRTQKLKGQNDGRHTKPIKRTSNIRLPCERSIDRLVRV